MIRPLTCVCLLLAGGSGLYLYQSKHRAQMLDREIEHTLKATDAARGRIGALRGEWTLLNESERLAALSQSHLGLKPLAPSQYVTTAELGVRLPPPAAPGTIYTPGEEEATPAADPLPPAPTPAPAPIVPPLASRPILAVARAQPLPPAAPSRPPAQAVSALQPSSPLPPPRPIGAYPLLAPLVNVSTVVTSPVPRPAAPRPTPPAANTAGPPIGESVARMARLQAGVPAAGVAAPAPQPAYSAPASNQPIASALGGVRPLLPPPVPYGSAMAASASTR